VNDIPQDLEPDEPFTIADIPDAIFPSNNIYGIPLLDIHLCADYLVAPVCTWGSIRRNQAMHGCWSMYVDDYRFERLWTDPSALINSDCKEMMEVNFTVTALTPRAVQLHQTYRKRWLSALAQSHGISILVDLNVSANHAEDNLLGVPDGWWAFSTRGYTDQLDSLCFEHAVAQDKAGRTDPLFAVYGGGTAVKDWCLHKPGAIHIPETMAIEKERKRQWQSK
jgi:Domain of unknown function (DUF4417)